MLTRLFLILFLLINLEAAEVKSIEFKGNDSNLLSDFSSSKLLQVIGAKYPPAFAFWKKDPTFKHTFLKIGKKS